MTEVEDKWQRVLAGDGEVDFLEMGGLIAPDTSERTLWDKFGTLPNATTLIRRLRRLQTENRVGNYITPDPGHRRPRPEIEKRARAYRDAVRRFLGTSGEGAQDLAGDRIEWVYDNAAFLALGQDTTQPHSAVGDDLDDAFAEYFWAKEPWGASLYEAVLRLTTYPALTRYVMADTVGFPLNEEDYYDLWTAGGDVLFMRGYMVVLCEAGPG